MAADQSDGPPTGAAGIRHALDNAEVFSAAADDDGYPDSDDDAGKTADVDLPATPAVPLSRKRPAPRDLVIQLGLQAELWHGGDFGVYATVPVGGLYGHRENHALRSLGFRRWILSAYGDAYPRTLPNGRTVPGTVAAKVVSEALDCLEAEACRGIQHDPRVRVGGLDAGLHGRAIYLDLGRPDWSVARIDGEGWRIERESPMKFIRPAGLRPLPEPVRGGSIKELWTFINVTDKADRILIIAWLLMALRPTGPYPALILNGEQGSAKTSTCRVLRRLIDPNLADMRSVPKDDQNLMLTASNSHVIAFDNLSTISGDLADGLCRIATGGGFATRRLFSDNDEIIINVCKPILFNGIPALASRPDLAERAITVTLPAIPDDARRPEAEFWRDFEAAAPRILGALLGGVSFALKWLPETTLPRLPRMADFALWATAAGPYFVWSDGAFMAAYQRNACKGVQELVEADHVAVAVRSLMETEWTWQGTASALLSEINSRTSEDIQREKGWPKDAARLGNRLRRVAPALRRLGIEIDLDARVGKNRTRVIGIVRRPVADSNEIGADSGKNGPSADNPLNGRDKVDADSADGKNTPPIPSPLSPERDYAALADEEWLS